jgi:transposase
VQVLAALETAEPWLDRQPEAATAPEVQASRAAAQQVRRQDVAWLADPADPAARGQPTVRRGVSRDRRSSREDEHMRPGRKSRRVRVDGYKRPVLHDLESGLVCAVGLTAENAAAASVTDALDSDLKAHHLGLSELAERHLDRGYLSSRWVRERPRARAVSCKAWPVRTGSRFPKTALTLDWEHHLLRCPAHVERPFTPGGTVHFPAAVCAACPLRERCTTSTRGRSVSIHPMSTSWPSCVSANKPRPVGPNCARESPSNTPWPLSATGRDVAPATVATASIYSTCVAAPSWTISTS